MADRCTGHCCTAFSIPYSPEELQRALERSRKPAPPPAAQAALELACGGQEPPIPCDIEMLCDMLVHLGEFQSVRFWPHEANVTDPLHHFYTCRHLQPNGDCGVYDQRPEVCRSYPYGKACERELCTWDAARDGLVPNARDVQDDKVHLPVIEPS